MILYAVRKICLEMKVVKSRSVGKNMDVKTVLDNYFRTFKPKKNGVAGVVESACRNFKCLQ